MLAPLRNTEVPPECFVAHITANCNVFCDYAAEEGLIETDRLIPSAQDGPILCALPGLPWRKIELPDDGIPVVMVILETGNIHNYVFLSNSATYVVRNLDVAVAVSKFLLLPSVKQPALVFDGLTMTARASSSHLCSEVSKAFLTEPLRWRRVSSSA